jgi:hypothetical protein
MGDQLVEKPLPTHMTTQTQTFETYPLRQRCHCDRQYKNTLKQLQMYRPNENLVVSKAKVSLCLTN